MTERTFGARPHPYIRPNLEAMADLYGDDDDFWEDEDEEESESTDDGQPDLKPCPFCGSKVEIERQEVARGSSIYAIIHPRNSCIMHFPHLIFPSEDAAIKGWNARPGESKARDEGFREAMTRYST